jgi:serine/threonine protein kinase
MQLMRFTYQELEIATDHFHESRLLGCGSGASGSLIYHGLLDDGTYVAVKKIQRDSIHDFSAEFWHDIKVREKVHHPNVVNMRGYCEGGGKGPDGPPILLVFDYMPNGSVLDALLSDDDSLLSWDRRFSIALGVVMGLEYLHEHNIPPITHGKIKPSNILLDRYVTLHPPCFSFLAPECSCGNVDGYLAALITCSSVCGCINL